MTQPLRFAALLALLVALAAPWSLRAAEERSPPRFVIETVAGNGQRGDLPPNAKDALNVPIDNPFGVEIGPDAALYITSIGQHRVLKMSVPGGAISCVAGSGAKGYAGDGGPADKAQLNEPYEVRFDLQRNMYFVEMQNHLIRRVDPTTGVISTIAGNGAPGYGGDGGFAAAAQFRQPHSIALDDLGILYVADIGNHRVRRIDPASGTIRSIAGNGEKQLPRDASAAEGQPILGPRALHIVGRTMWIALREGNSVWKLDLDTGIIHHVAGTGKAGYSGDGGAAREATFNGPKGIAATPEGFVYVVDSENQVVRLIDSKQGKIYTIAGGGPAARGFAGEMTSALEAKVDRPHGICVAPGGALYLGDTNNQRVRWLHP